MSESELTRETLVENLNLVDCFWGEINFACTAKKLPSFKDRKTWTYQTDKMKIGKTVCGTIEGMEPIELTVVSSFKFVFQQLTNAATSGTSNDLKFVHRKGNVVEMLVVPNCEVLGVSLNETDNNGVLTATVKFQPEGGGDKPWDVSESTATT